MSLFDHCTQWECCNAILHALSSLLLGALREANINVKKFENFLN